MFISETGWTILPPSKNCPNMPTEKSPVVGFELPPRKSVIRIPLPRSLIISSTEREPGGTIILLVEPEVGSQPSFLL